MRPRAVAKLGRNLPLALAACLAALRPAPAWAQGGWLELAVEATYLYKFVPYVAWPKIAFASPASPFVLCVGGDDPFGSLLDEAIAGKRAAGRPIVLRRLAVVTRQSGCEILYVAGSPAQSVAAALDAVHGTPVLTVTGPENPGAAKGIINFVIEKDHIRFEIDDADAAQNGLVISSKLLSLAVRVTPRA